VANVPSGVIIENATEILPESEIFVYPIGEGRGSYAGFSDFFRYKLLLERGGWWVDADVVALKPFEFAAPYIIATERGVKVGPPKTATCVIYCPPESDLMRFCLKRCQEIDKRTLRWHVIGPPLLAEAVRKTGLESCQVNPEVFCPVNWFDVESLFGNGNVGDSHAIHLWNEMWRRKGINKDKQYAAESLYERLQQEQKN
jgi:mannosyltransferase OCH1-like enzyme